VAGLPTASHFYNFILVRPINTPHTEHPVSEISVIQGNAAAPAGCSFRVMKVNVWITGLFRETMPNASKRPDRERAQNADGADRAGPYHDVPVHVRV
jgi:hypothetical protein